MENGGAERVISNITLPLSNKYKIYLILLKNTKFYDISKNIKIISLSKINNNILMLTLFPFYVWKLKKLTKKHNPHKIISFLEIANFINILMNKDAIISFRTSLDLFNVGIIGKVYKFFIKLLYPKAKKIIVNSKENKQNLSSYLNIPLHKIQTIHNPINHLQIKKLIGKQVKLPFTKKHTHKIFITIGRLNKQKNTSALIHAFKKLSSNYALLILGDGPEKKILQRLINKYNLQKQVFLLGLQKNVFQYLVSADYFIFSSNAEGFPNVLIEATACNIPIITSDFKTGAREIINPNLGFKEKIKYPYYGPNGVLLSLKNFQKDFAKINLNKINKSQNILDNFNITEITKKWILTIESD